MHDLLHLPPMAGGALSILSEKIWTAAGGWTDAVAVFPVGPNEIGGPNVDELDMYGRLLLGSPVAVVVNVSAAPTGTGAVADVELMSSADPAFGTSKTVFTRLAALTKTSGRKGTGVGPHLLGYFSGGGNVQRYLRWRITPHATGAVSFFTMSCWLLPDFDSSYAT